MKAIKEKGPGIVICALMAAVAMSISKLSVGSFSLEVIGAPIFAILMGMVITLLKGDLASSKSFATGIKFTSKKVLQYAVIILGFSLNLGTILAVGSKSLPVIVVTIATSLITAYVMMKVLKVDKDISCLIGVGSSICGGSAIAATASVIEADDKDVAQAISVIFFFNVLAALIFPTLGQALGLGTEGFAIFAGTAVNDTSSVTACASTAEGLYGVDGILSAAVTVKLTRTLAIIPITLAIAIYRTRKAQKSGEGANGYSIKKIFPFFILYFIAAAIATTLVGAIPGGAFTAFYMGPFVKATKWLAKFFIAMAMGAIGLNTNMVELIKKGGKPILMGLTCWVMITISSLGMQLLTGIFHTNL